MALRRILLCALLALAVAGCMSTSKRPASQATDTPAQINANLGLAYLQQGKKELARDKLQRALELDPNLASAHHYMGELYQQLGEYDEAERHYRRAVALQPADSMLRNNFGVFLCRYNKVDEAEEQFLAATKDPFYQTPELAYENIGLCALRKPDKDKAEKYFRMALQRDPQLRNSLYQMSALTFERGNHLAARGFLQRYLDAGPPVPEALWLGVRIERAMGDDTAAQDYAKQLQRQFPTSQEAQLLTGNGRPP